MSSPNLASKLRLTVTKELKLRQTSLGYELTLCDTDDDLEANIVLAPSQIDGLLLDLTPASLDSVHLSHVAGHVLIERHDLIFARVPESDFGRLYEAANEGVGETITPAEGPDLY